MKLALDVARVSIHEEHIYSTPSLSMLLLRFSSEFHEVFFKFFAVSCLPMLCHCITFENDFMYE